MHNQTSTCQLNKTQPTQPQCPGTDSEKGCQQLPHFTRQWKGKRKEIPRRDKKKSAINKDKHMVVKPISLVKPAMFPPIML